MDTGHLISTIPSLSIKPSGLATKNVKFLFIKIPQGWIFTPSFISKQLFDIGSFWIPYLNKKYIN